MYDQQNCHRNIANGNQKCGGAYFMKLHVNPDEKPRLKHAKRDNIASKESRKMFKLSNET